MPTVRRTSLVAPALLCCLAWAGPALAPPLPPPPPPPPDKEYTIKMDRPAKVGDKVKVSGASSSEQKMVTTPKGQAPESKTETQAVTYAGQMEVLEVGPGGLPSKIAVTFDKCEVTVDGVKSEPVPKGGVVTMERKDGEVTIELTDGELSEDVKKALEGTELPPDPDSADASYGADKPQKVGGQWAINADAAAKNMKKDGLEVTGKDIKGKTTLVRVHAVRDVPCLDLEVDLALEKFPVPPERLPAGGTGKGTAKAKRTGLFPVDGALPVMQETLDMSIDMEMDLPAAGDEPATNIKVSLKATATRDMTPVK